MESCFRENVASIITNQNCATMSESKDSEKLSTMFSERGAKLLLLNGFKFTKNRKTKTGQKWRCCFKMCKAQLFTDDNGEQLLQAKVEHNHEPPANLHRKIISNSIRMKCKAGEASNQRPAKIIKTEIESAPDNISEKITKKDVDNIRRNLYTAKKSEVSKFIEGIHKALDSIPPTKTTEAKNEVLRKAVTNKIKIKQEEDLGIKPSKLVKDELAKNTEVLQQLSKRDIKCIRDNVTNHRLKKLSKSSSLEAQEVELSDVLSSGSEENPDLCLPNGSGNTGGSSSGSQEDSFDLFGKYIASLLRGIGNPHALKLQSSITSLVTKAMCDTNQTKSSDTK
ncbi:uncharacterized protein LOC111051676 isoform X2 [Nilaparvata lugens]|uniref:uncharacterized protein LOC111051676 isoform X2 n=1 Tax=Nilaparvata lugens TaxID=108931 RepID=UPI00193D22DA|nr:uncharacterized protein LOC111051676 isoform X2 [Nilaparvata lugens]